MMYGEERLSLTSATQPIIEFRVAHRAPPLSTRFSRIFAVLMPAFTSTRYWQHTSTCSLPHWREECALQSMVVGAAAAPASTSERVRKCVFGLLFSISRMPIYTNKIKSCYQAAHGPKEAVSSDNLS
jgi:hypothetical protein